MRIPAAIAAAALLVLLSVAPAALAAPQEAGFPPLLGAPIWVYNNWSAYDELSDEVPLTEELAMRELGEVVRLRRLGVHFDYYMMDAFWYDRDGGYRTWRTASWPNGPDRWLAAVKAAGMKPGLWFSTNTLTHMHAAPQWQDSLAAGGHAMAMYRGGFLPDFIDVLQYWYARGIRMFKFDMADFGAASKGDEALPKTEIRARNAQALHAALREFRRAHPDVVLVAFNGIVGDVSSARSPLNPFNQRWLDVFDSLYSGDPRPSNVPQMDFWRSVDIYSDRMVRHFADSGIPLSRIDSTSVMLGDTGTNYRRRLGAWQGSLLLMAAHGGWINTVHGNLEYLGDDGARWFARVQALYGPLQRHGATEAFGSLPGDRRPYGFGSADAAGAVYAVVNPGQQIASIDLPRIAPPQPPAEGGRIVFRDAGYAPSLSGDTVTLGPGQFVLVGFGRYASREWDLGIQDDIVIPHDIEPVAANFAEIPNALEAVIEPPATGDLRIIMQQQDIEGGWTRSHSNAEMSQFFTITAWQDGRQLPVAIRYDKIVWSGLSWAAGEIRHADIAPGIPIRLRLSSAAADPDLRLGAQVYRVSY
jgi:hypothetical protein